MRGKTVSRLIPSNKTTTLPLVFFFSVGMSEKEGKKRAMGLIYLLASANIIFLSLGFYIFYKTRNNDRQRIGAKLIFILAFVYIFVVTSGLYLLVV